MIKRINLARRKDGMLVEEFHAYWTGPHVAIVRQLKNLRGLRLNLVLDGGADREWDGIGELWFDSIEDAREAFEIEPARSLLAEDRPKFLGRNQVYFVKEHTVLPPP